MASPTIPDLPADLDWLIRLPGPDRYLIDPPTIEDLDAFWKGCAPQWLMDEAQQTRTTPFAASNLFSSDRRAPWMQSMYDLAPGRFASDNLADAMGWDLRLWPPDDEPAPPDDHFIPTGDGVSIAIAGGVHYVLHETGLLQYVADQQLFHGRVVMGLVDPTSRLPMRAPQEQIRRRALCDEHNRQVLWLCDVLWSHLHDAIFCSNNRPQSDTWPWTDHKLHLVPHVSLPDQHLIHRLSKAGITEYLLLLVARHELGHWYRMVRQWLDIPIVDRGTAPLNDHALQRMRARGRLVTEAGLTAIPHSGSGQRVRHDAPKAQLTPVSDLARLYVDFWEWYQRVYAMGVDQSTCVRCGIPLAPPRREYCTRCGSISKREKAAERQRQRRTRQTQKSTERIRQVTSRT